MRAQPAAVLRRESGPALKRRFAILVVLAVFVWLGVMLVGGDSGALALRRARAKLADLEAKAGAVEEENARLRAENLSLGSDDRVVQRIAREDLMMGRPDEEVILVPDPKVEAARRRRTAADREPAAGQPVRQR